MLDKRGSVIDRRSGKDRRREGPFGCFFSDGIERRSGEERRSQKERRAGWVRVSDWYSVYPWESKRQGPL
jgi:hypothetical protein